MWERKKIDMIQNETGKKVCVITGGGSGMGLETAKIMGKTHYVIICGRTVQKLEKAVQELQEEGIACEAFPCDVSDIQSVRRLAVHALSKGCVQAVIHAAGMSPHMGSAEQIMATNTLGTVYMNSEFSKVMEAGSCILDVSSMSAYLTPKIVMPRKLYRYALEDAEIFSRKINHRLKMLPKSVRPGVAYGVSKDFVIWYSKKTALLYGEKGIRVVCVSPGNFETPMGKLEGEEADKFTKYSALKRFGRPEEIAFLFASIVDERNSYLTGLDIICDGGVIASGVSAMVS